MAWDDSETILVGDRRMRVRRRRSRRGLVSPWVLVGLLVVLLGAAAGILVYVNRPQGFDAVEGNAVTSAGGFQAKENGDGIITVAMEIRNVSDETITVADARVIPPAGLTLLAVAIVPPVGPDRNLNLDAELPPSAPFTLGTDGEERNAIVEARFRVDCDALPATSSVTGEQIFVTVRLAGKEREEELTPPVYDGVPWLTATARGTCDRTPTGGAIPTPLPTL